MKAPWWVWPAGIAALLVLVGVGGSSASKLLARERARASEAQRLADQGMLVSARQGQEELKEDLERLLGDNRDLRAELARARSAAPGAKPVATARLRTRPVPAAGTPREPLPNPRTLPPGTASCPPVPPSEDVSCLLAEGDVGELRMESVELQTKAGNHVVVAALSAWRLTPEPATVLLHGAAEAPLSRVSEALEADPRGVSHGLGVMGALGKDGWMVGPVAGLRPWDVFGLRVELMGGAAFGPSGSWVTQVSVLARR